MAATETFDQGEMNRNDMLDAFLYVANLCEPDHAFRENSSVYPLSRSDVHFSYHQNNSSTIASCGAGRKDHSVPVAYSVTTERINRMSPELHLTILVHEVTHITEGAQTEGGTHNPTFWKSMMANAWTVRENWDAVTEKFDANKEEFITEVIDDVNASMIDRRVETVQERQNENALLMGRPNHELVEHDDNIECLTDINGVGETTAEALRHRGFTKVKDVQQAAARELMCVQGIGNDTVSKIKATLND